MHGDSMDMSEDLPEWDGVGDSPIDKGETDDMLSALRQQEDDEKRIAEMRSRSAAIVARTNRTGALTKDVTRYIVRLFARDWVAHGNARAVDLIRMSNGFEEMRAVLEQDDTLWRLLWIKEFPYLRLHVFSTRFQEGLGQPFFDRVNEYMDLPYWIANRKSVDDRYRLVPWRRFFEWCTFFNRRCLRELANEFRAELDDWVGFYNKNHAAPPPEEMPRPEWVVDRNEIRYGDEREDRRVRPRREHPDYVQELRFEMIPYGEPGHDIAVKVWEIISYNQETEQDEWRHTGYIDASGLAKRNYRGMKLDVFTRVNRDDTYTWCPIATFCRTIFTADTIGSNDTIWNAFMNIDDVRAGAIVSPGPNGTPLPAKMANFMPYQKTLFGLCAWYMSEIPLRIVLPVHGVDLDDDYSEWAIANSNRIDQILSTLPDAPHIDDVWFVGHKATNINGDIGHHLTEVQGTTTMTIAGEAKREVAPNTASITCTATRIGEVRERVSKEQAELCKRVKSAIEKNGGVVEYESFSTNPQRDYESKPPRIVGYEISSQLSVKVKDLLRLSALMGAALDAGGEISGIDMSLDDDTAIKAGVLGDAIRNARSKAMASAEASGFYVREVLSVTESSSRYYHRGGRSMAYESAASSPSSKATMSSPSVEPGLLSYTADVTLVALLEPQSDRDRTGL